MPAGRPFGTFKYDDIHDLQSGIDDYFAECEDKGKPYTMSGLALSLNITRQTLINYGRKDKYFDPISHARERCQAYAEAALYDNKAANGAKFVLSNNYEGWTERSQVDIGGKDGQPLLIVNLTDAQIWDRINALKPQDVVLELPE